MINNIKRGELTTQQIVLLIILIVSFAVILIFIFYLNLGETSEGEICHNSVVTRGSDVLPADSVPLKCKTSYICISEDGSCEKLTNPRIEKVNSQDDIYEVFAEEMRECWWMFGEGKVNYVSSEFFPDLYCSICSQVAFDDSVIKIQGVEGGQIREDVFYKDYLSKTKMKNADISYNEYLYGTRDFSLIHKGDFGSLNVNKQYYIMMGITSKVSKLKWIAGGTVVAAGVAAGAILFAPAAVVGSVELLTIKGILLTSAGAVAGGVGGNYVGTFAEGASGNDYLKPTIVEANSELFKGLECSQVTTYS